MKGVSLHHHSTFSYGDGYGSPESHVARAVELEMSAIAATEHGNVSSHVQYERACNEAGIKFIPGLEAYTAPPNMRQAKNQRKWHLTILAMNDVGYKNLMRLVTMSWDEGFYRWPTVMGNWLRELNEGLIVLSGCADSKLACDLLGGKGRELGSIIDARRTVEMFRDIFGDRYYLEVQRFPQLERTCELNPVYESLSRQYGIPLVATADVHYPYPADNEMQKILHAASRNTGTVARAEASWEYDILLTHPESDADWVRDLRGTGLSKHAANTAVATTSTIADRCSVELPKAERLKFPVELFEAETSDELIWAWLRRGWEYRARTNAKMRGRRQSQYVDRLKYEMDIVSQKGFVDYFLMLSEIVTWCKDNGIPVGPARGSAAASLACYLLRITEIDPLPFPSMLFERFIDLNRTDLPDVDLDFDDERRHELVAHVVEMYGEDHVGNIGTFTKYRGKNSLDDVARVYTIPKWEVEKVKDLLITRSGGDSRGDATLEDTVSYFPIAAEVFKQYPDLWQATRLEGNYKGMSVHAAGLVISNDPLTDNVAYYTREDKRNKVTRRVLSVDKYDAEYLNLLKADFLGLTTMGMIRHALAMIDMSLEDMYVVANPTINEEPAVIDSFRRGDVVGIFQYGGGATSIVNNDVRPDTFLELCDINALSRPGPLHSGSTSDYINIKHGRQEPNHLHPLVDDITKHTKYCMIYQEQILKTVREVGGFDWTHAQEIRKIISLKHGEAAFNMKLEMFLDGAKTLHGIDAETAQKIWVRLATAGTYAFNAAHCVSYSMLAWWTMWLKVHHPQAFYAACLRKYKSQQYVLMRDAMRHDIELRPPEVNESDTQWDITPDKGAILAGYQQVPGVGESKAEAIINDRLLNGEFESWGELLRVPGIGAKKLRDIVEMTESDDPFGIHRVDRVLGLARRMIRRGVYGPLPTPTHDGASIPTGDETVPVVYLGIPYFRNPQDVVEDERARTGEDYADILARMRRPDLIKKMAVRCFDDSDVTVYLRYNRFTFPKFEAGLWSINLDHDVMLVSGVRRGGFGTSIHVKRMWVFDGNDFIENKVE